MQKIISVYGSTSRKAHRLFCLLLVWLMCPAHAHGTCEAALLSPNVSRLAEGDRASSLPATQMTLDNQTIEDLEVDSIEQMLAPYLRTDFGRRRWAYTLRHPDLTNVRERQNLVRYLADHLDEFESFQQHFETIGGAEKHILDQFLKLEKNQESMLYDVVWTTYLWACYIGPMIGHYFFDLPAYASFFIAGQAWGTSMSNVKRVRKVRESLWPYRIHLEGAELAHAGLQKVANPIARELASVLDPRPLPKPKGLQQKLQRLFDHFTHTFLNKAPDPFHSVRRRLRQMEPIVGTTLFGIPIGIDISLIWDRFFISNYRLRDLQNKLVENKEDMAALFSALGEFEMFLALARFYKDHRAQTTFLKIEDVNSVTHFEVRQARSPLMALRDFENTVPNNLSLGDVTAPVEVLVGESHQGARTRAELFGQINLATLAGMPVFAESGSMTPNFVVSQLSPVQAPRGVTAFRAEALRWAEIQKVVASTPNVLVLLHEPFATVSDDRQLALRSQMVRELSETGALSVFVTRTQTLSLAIEDWPNIARRQMAEYVAVPYRQRWIRNRQENPDSFEILRHVGVAPDFVAEAQLNLEQIERGGPVRRWRQNVIPFRPKKEVETRGFEISPRQTRAEL